MVIGVLPLLIALVVIASSMSAYPGFSLSRNALSDLGHSVRSPAAVTFNLGLQTSGLLLAAFALLYGRRAFPATSWCLLSSAYFLQLVAVFDELYGRVHGAVSVAFFLSLLASALAYMYERRSALLLVSIAIGMGGWIAFWAGLFEWGVAVPEAIAIAATALWYADMLRGVAERR